MVGTGLYCTREQDERIAARRHGSTLPGLTLNFRILFTAVFLAVLQKFFTDYFLDRLRRLDIHKVMLLGKDLTEFPGGDLLQILLSIKINKHNLFKRAEFLKQFPGNIRKFPAEFQIKIISVFLNGTVDNAFHK